MSLPGVLETARLRMRPLEERDKALYVRIYTDDKLMEHVGQPLTPAGIEAAFERVCRLNRSTELRYWCWVIEVRDGGANAGLLALVGSTRSAEIGAMILADWHSRGVATEIIACLADHAFAEYGVVEVFTRHRKENGQAHGLMQKLDFVEAASLPEDEGRTRWVRTRSMWPGCQVPVPVA